MRFIPGGPSIPDDLLIARDAGDVIFFCGAGVSFHKAKLPDFFGLGEKVIAGLGAGEKSLSAQLLRINRELKPIDGIGGLIAADRLFSLLERDFETASVRAKVAEMIAPPANVDLSAHRTLLDLATGRDQTVRLVTTNFDLLFEACDASMRTWGPPILPDPRSPNFRGIVHLHGRVNGTYTGPEDDEFVISSADFGRAYLSDGWATKFMRSLLERFQIVFVGYSADDPPVQYLLEALNLRAGGRSRLFAFQAGISAALEALWEHRGVRAIPFDTSKGFGPLWETLEAWAERARDVDAWHASLLEKAAAGPEKVDAHVRGQIAHLFSTRDGAKRVSTAATPLPASWLLVLDPHLRYAPPFFVNDRDETGDQIDPFEFLGLDTDVPPLPTEDVGAFAERQPPDGAWDAFLPVATDRDDPVEIGLAGLRGAAATRDAALSPRLDAIADWILRLAAEPLALWWAAGQRNVHPKIRDRIETLITHGSKDWPTEVRQGWLALKEEWADKRIQPQHKIYDIQANASLGGWSNSLIRDYSKLFRPQIRITQIRSHPLVWSINGNPSKALYVAVDYPRPHQELAIPDEFLQYAVSQFRSNLELALSLEAEHGRLDGIYIQTTRPDDGAEPLSIDEYGLTGPIAYLQRLLERLGKLDRDAARAEISGWPRHDDKIFGRLRIWAASSDLTTPDEACSILLAFSDDTFWGGDHQRDLLYAIRDRWIAFTSDQRKELEDRLLTTSYSWENKSADARASAEAYHRLDRIAWLADAGVEFSFNLKEKITELQKLAPDWTNASGTSAADSHAPVVSSVSMDDDPTDLLDVPIDKILEQASNIGRFDIGASIERRPFLGLSEAKPVRALTALSSTKKRGIFPKSAWETFLRADSRKTDRPRLANAIATHLARLTRQELSDLDYAVSGWLDALGVRLYSDLSQVLPKIWPALIAALPIRAGVRTRSTDSSWAFDALNAPVGKLTQVVLRDPVRNGLGIGAGLPKHWSACVDKLLALPGDMRRHALVIAGHQASWFYLVDPTWTDDNLFPLLIQESPDANALWDGIFWAAHLPNSDFFARLKPGLMLRAKRAPDRRGEGQVIAQFLLIGWGDQGDGPNKRFSDGEFREVLVECDDRLRTDILWHLQHWANTAESPWHDRVVPFLTNVWPNHRALRRPEISAKLANFALGIGDLFPEVVSAILPRLVPIRASPGLSIHFDVIPDSYPATQSPGAALDLFWAILAEDRSQWPYGIERLLDALSNLPETKADPRLSELRRRRAF